MQASHSNGPLAIARQHALGWVLGTLCALLPAVAAAAGAMVTDLQGGATIASAGQMRDATILTNLAADAQVELKDGARLVALYLDAGDEYTFRGPARIVFRANAPEVQVGSAPEKRSHSLGKGIRIRPDRVAQGATVMRSLLPTARLRLFSASGTRVLDTQPVFRWQDLQPGVRYQFALYDDTGRALHEAQVEASSFTWPAQLPLREGGAYTWVVSTNLPDGRKYSSTGVFSVAGADLRAQAKALRVEPGTPVSDRVAYAAWLDDMELRDEARTYWRALSAERPDDPRLRQLAEP